MNKATALALSLLLASAAHATLTPDQIGAAVGHSPVEHSAFAQYSPGLGPRNSFTERNVYAVVDHGTFYAVNWRTAEVLVALRCDQIALVTSEERYAATVATVTPATGAKPFRLFLFEAHGGPELLKALNTCALRPQP